MPTAEIVSVAVFEQLRRQGGWRVTLRVWMLSARMGPATDRAHKPARHRTTFSSPTLLLPLASRAVPRLALGSLREIGARAELPALPTHIAKPSLTCGRDCASCAPLLPCNRLTSTRGSRVARSPTRPWRKPELSPSDGRLRPASQEKQSSPLVPPADESSYAPSPRAGCWTTPSAAVSSRLPERRRCRS